jgi:hypothetical protein
MNQPMKKSRKELPNFATCRCVYSVARSILHAWADAKTSGVLLHPTPTPYTLHPTPYTLHPQPPPRHSHVHPSLIRLPLHLSLTLLPPSPSLPLYLSLSLSRAHVLCLLVQRKPVFISNVRLPYRGCLWYRV